MSKLFFRSICVLTACIVSGDHLFAHNGSIAHARPLGVITVDGHLSDWPRGLAKYLIQTQLSDNKPASDADFSGFFQVGYREADRSLYIAFTITDDDFIEDTTANVQWNSQDGLELSIDARHLPVGSGVASFMYSKKLRNTNNTYDDPFARIASWKIMEVAMSQQGNTRIYEWRIMLNEYLQPGKSVGFDFTIFDKDNDGSFTFAGWGKGGYKYRYPNSLGDVLILPAGEKLATVTGRVGWDKETNVKLPGCIHFQSAQDGKLWFAASLDSTGNYSAIVPAGQYKLRLPFDYFSEGKNVYVAGHKQALVVSVKPGSKINAPSYIISATPAPDLIPEKGILHQFSDASINRIDNFIETYRRYYHIPGVSLALIKDGKVVYHKTYGVKNTFTNENLDDNTLFEAASITKPVFAFAVQRLAERGIIDLDKPLYEYLPFPDIAYDERYKLITARHVLTHRTGFPNWRYMNADGKLDLKFTPGTNYGYSGEGFEYLKIVVEKITGKKVEQVLQEEVIAPMGLYHTFFSANDSLKKMKATGHFDRIPNQKGLPESPGMAYSMHTEAKAFTRFMLYLLEQKGLNAQTYESMLKKYSDYNYDPEDEKPRYPAYMGMSLEVRETPFGKSFGHGGNNGDFKCIFEVYKDLKMGYVIFTNSNTSDRLLQLLRDFLVEGKNTTQAEH